MSFYDEMAGVADELLREFGAPMVLRREVPGTYDPATGSTVDTTVDYGGTGALFDFETQQAGTLFAGQTLIQVGDKQALVSPAGVPLPKAGDLLMPGSDIWVDGNAYWQVQNVKEVNPAGTAVLYELHLRH